VQVKAGKAEGSTTYLSEFALFGFCFRSFRSLLRPKACLFANQVVQGNKMHWNAEESARDPLSPRIGELDACDFGQNINAHRSNSNLVDHLLLGECLRSDPIMVERSAKLLERPTTRREFCGELYTHTSRSFV